MDPSLDVHLLDLGTVDTDELRAVTDTLHRAGGASRARVWRTTVRRLFFPRAQRQMERAANPDFAELDKAPDWLEWASRIVVVLSVVALALAEPTRPRDSSLSNALRAAEYVFVSFFIVELFLRVLAFGVDKTFRERWNLLDLAVAGIGAAGIVLAQVAPPLGDSAAGLQAVRLLKVLRVVEPIAEVRILLTTVRRSARFMVDVGALFLLFWVSGALWGVGLFKGDFRGHCIRQSAYNETLRIEEAMRSPLVGRPLANGSAFEVLVAAAPTGIVNGTLLAALSLALSPPAFECGGVFDEMFLGQSVTLGCDADAVCDLTDDATKHALLRGFVCPFSYVCLPTQNPGRGFISYDHFGLGLLTTQTLVTMEAFSTVAFAIAGGTNKATAIYSVFIVLVGSLFLVNLLLAKMTVQFEACRSALLEERRNEDRQRQARNRGRIRTRLLPEIVGSYLDVVLLGHHARRCLALFDHAPEASLGLLLAYVRAWPHSDRGAEAAGGRSLEALQRAGVLDAVPFEGDVESALHVIAKQHDYCSKAVSVPLSRRERLMFSLEYALHSTVLFSAASVFVTVASVGALAALHAGMDSAAEAAIERVAVPVTAALIGAELLLRFLASHPLLFARNGLHVVELVVFVCVVAGIIAETPVLFCVLPARLLGVSRLARHVQGARRWVPFLSSSLRASAGLLVLIMLDAGVGALLAMHTIGALPCDGARALLADCPSFGTFTDAFLTTFQLVTGDNWHTLMFRGMAHMSSDIRRALLAAAFVLHYMFSTYVLVNMFIAVLVGSSEALFEEDHATDTVTVFDVSRKFIANVKTDFHTHAQAPAMVRLILEAARDKALTVLRFDDPSELQYRRQRARREEAYAEEGRRRASEERSGSKAKGSGGGILRPLLNYIQVRTAVAPLRVIAQDTLCDVLRSKPAMLVVQGAVCACLAAVMLDSPVTAPDSVNGAVSRAMSHALTAFFSVEMALQVIAKGPRRFFFRWPVFNAVEIGLCVVGVVEWVLSQWYVINWTYLKIGFLTRTAKQLYGTESIALVLATIRAAVPPLRGVLLIAVLVFCGFAAAGAVLFRDRFGACIGDAALHTGAACRAARLEWVRAPFHFDHFGASLVSLFLVAALEGWGGIMSLGIAHADGAGTKLIAAAYFIGFVFVGAFFIVNLLGSLLIQTFERTAADIREGRDLLVEAHDRWWAQVAAIADALPLEQFIALDDALPLHGHPTRRLRLALFQLRRHPFFVRTLIVFSVLGAVVGVADFLGAPIGIVLAITVAYDADCAAALLDVVLGVAAIGWAPFIAPRANRFDVFVAAALSIDLALRRAYPSFVVGHVFRSLRAMRILRHLPVRRRAADVLERISRSAKALTAVTVFLIFFVFCAALIAMRLFGRLPRDGVTITSVRNFETIPTSLLLTCSVIFGSDWADVFGASMTAPPDCDEQLNACGRPVGAPFFFVLLAVTGNFCLFNIFTAMLIDSFNALERGIDNHLTETDVVQFVERWFEIDPERTLTAPAAKLLALLRALPPEHPFRPPPLPHEPLPECALAAYIAGTRIEESADGRVAFVDVLQELSRVSIGRPWLADEGDRMRDTIQQRLLPVITVSERRRQTFMGPHTGAGGGGGVRALEPRPLAVRSSVLMLEVLWAARRGPICAAAAHLRAQRAPPEPLPEDGLRDLLLRRDAPAGGTPSTHGRFRLRSLAELQSNVFRLTPAELQALEWRVLQDHAAGTHAIRGIATPRGRRVPLSTGAADRLALMHATFASRDRLQHTGPSSGEEAHSARPQRHLRDIDRATAAELDAIEMEVLAALEAPVQ